MKHQQQVITPDELQALQAYRGYPLITLCMPTHRAFPDNQQDPIRFKDLVRSVRDRLARELPKREVEQVYERLASLGERIDWAHTLDGLVVFLSDTIERIVYLPVHVRERAIIDHTFETRDVVVALSRLLHYWVLTLSTSRTRLFEGYNDHLQEVISDTFPFVYDGPHPGDPDNPLPGGFGVNPSAYRDEQYRHYFRHLDRALLQTIGQENPLLIICGVVKNRALFNEVRSARYEVIAELDGSMDDASPAQLVERISPALEQYRERRSQTALEELSAAIKAGRYTCSLADMWHFSRQGRAELLVVERDYAAAGYWDEERKTFTLAEDPTAPGVVDDIVDDIIEATLQHRGRVVFVNPGMLTACEHIGMALRY
ncbi:MAG: hypothetical protein N2971_05725 [Chlorobi bacterium]|nr:hypothetical protein [Chlorobiota bacterium]